MIEYVIGIDGGATKSHLALFDVQGHKVDFAHWGPLNHENLKGGLVQLQEELDAFMGGVLAKNGLGIHQVRCAVLGMAGVDTKREAALVADIVRACGVKEAVVCNDGYLPVKAVSGQSCGICAISGTGCSVAGIDPSGRMIQVGGHGGLTGDMGGGAYLSEQMVRAIYTHLYKGRQSTLMKDLLFPILGVTDDLDFMDVLADRSAAKRFRLADHGYLVFEAAGRGDEVACRVLRESGEDYARSISGAIKRLSFPEGVPIDIVLAGSAFVKASCSLMIDTLKERLAYFHPATPLRFTLFDKPPVAGAVVWALEGIWPVADRPALIKSVCAQL